MGVTNNLVNSYSLHAKQNYLEELNFMSDEDGFGVVIIHGVNAQQSKHSLPLVLQWYHYKRALSVLQKLRR